jgi:hypothetical protein
MANSCINLQAAYVYLTINWLDNTGLFSIIIWLMFNSLLALRYYLSIPGIRFAKH